MRVSLALLLVATSLVGCRFQSEGLGGQLKSEGIGEVRGSSCDNGLNGASKQLYYHRAEGSEIFPFSWVRALTEETTGLPFYEFALTIGMLPDGVSPENPYGLPVGVTVAKARDAGIELSGVNCAACHVGEVTFGGESCRLDGAPNMFSIRDFIDTMSALIGGLTTDEQKLRRFVASRTGEQGATLSPEAQAFETAVVGFLRLVWAKGVAVTEGELTTVAAGLAAVPEDRAGTEISGVAAAAELKRFLRTGIAEMHGGGKLFSSRLQFYQGFLRARAPAGTAADGPGRTDAFGRAHNRLFRESPIPLTAPVSVPHIWGLARHAWVQWNANTTSVVERNIGQALGLGAIVAPDFSSTIDVKNLVAIERASYEIQPPKWPAFFPPPDSAKLVQGKELYQANCASCHDGYRTLPGGLRDYIEVPVDLIGTDPNLAHNFNAPMQLTSGRTTFPAALAPILTGIKHRYYAENAISAEQQEAWEKRGEWTAEERSRWRTNDAYPARPLEGIWASAPYLHNASVPTLYDLLLPASARTKRFVVGHRAFDPEKVGFEARPEPAQAAPMAFVLSTDQNGNSNAGHEYGARLSEPERLALLEYLKTL